MHYQYVQQGDKGGREAADGKRLRVKSRFQNQGLAGRRRRSSKKCSYRRCDGCKVVAALLEDDGGEIQSGDSSGGAREAGEGNFEVADGVGFVDVGAEGNDEGVRVIGIHASERDIEGEE